MEDDYCTFQEHVNRDTTGSPVVLCKGCCLSPYHCEPLRSVSRVTRCRSKEFRQCYGLTLKWVRGRRRPMQLARSRYEPTTDAEGAEVPVKESNGVERVWVHGVERVWVPASPIVLHSVFLRSGALGSLDLLALWLGRSSA